MSKFQTDTIIDAGDVSGNLTSPIINLQYNYGFAIQCSFDGAAATGAVKIQGSNDQENWSEIDSLTISGSNVLASNKDAIYWPFIRVYKAAGGTGNMTTTITIKGA